MNTCNTDTVLYELRVSSSRPPPHSATPSSTCHPSLSRRHHQKTIVFNGISANSWLFPIGLRQKDPRVTIKPREKSELRPRFGNGDCENPGPVTKRTSRVKDEQGTQSYETASDKGSSAEQNASGVETADAKLPGDNKNSDTNCSGDIRAQSAPATAANMRTLTSYEYDSIWERVPKRPQSTGSVFIVRKRNLPTGLGRHEYLQGRHIRSRLKETEAEESDEDRSVKLKPRPFTAPGPRKTRFSDQNRVWSSRLQNRPFSHAGVRGRELQPREHTTFPKPIVPFNASVDLVVTSFHYPKASPNSAPSDAWGEEASAEKAEDVNKTTYAPRPKTKSATYRRSAHHGGDAVDTIDDIKRSYLRRAKSAPPKVRSMDFSSSNTPPSANPREPSLYWRARSAYHKRVMTYGQDEIPDPSSEPTQNPCGSLWRPLMVGEDAGLMQHSAGCPYKCKGCFKACLVSADFMDKARAEKQLRKKEEEVLARQKRVPSATPRFLVRPPVVSRHRAKVNDPQNIVSIALAKSQPLYRVVHANQESKSGQTVVNSSGKAGSSVMDKSDTKEPGSEPKDQETNADVSKSGHTVVNSSGKAESSVMDKSDTKEPGSEPKDQETNADVSKSGHTVVNSSGKAGSSVMDKSDTKEPGGEPKNQETNADVSKSGHTVVNSSGKAGSSVMDKSDTKEPGSEPKDQETNADVSKSGHTVVISPGKAESGVMDKRDTKEPGSEPKDQETNAYNIERENERNASNPNKDDVKNANDVDATANNNGTKSDIDDRTSQNTLVRTKRKCRCEQN
ncbi:uncharacterized protein [Littorina saxatilis]|uniref:uncharacterized protein n=1 Tax=Littorina saxatilis TaxID=31220 RepID=UPI0038B5998D